MILPIYAYGHPVLKKKGKDIDATYEGLTELIANMFETMHHAHGVGLAAQQIGIPINLFVVDTVQLKKEDDSDTIGIKQAFINAEILEFAPEQKTMEEGCLSIPNIRGDVDRPEKIHVRYLDEQFIEHVEAFDGYEARVIQHELDHNHGKLFTEKLGSLKKQLIRRKLDAIRHGKIVADYQMKFMPS